MLNTTSTEFSYAEVWFTDQNNKAFEIEEQCKYDVDHRVLR